MLRRPVAIKLLHAESAADPSLVRRFEREARALARVGHPNVVGVFDVGEENGVRFIVMEAVEGITLRDLEDREGTLDVDRAGVISNEVAAGLGFAHRAGVIHRDVKPSNVLLADDGTVKVADLGIARLLPTDTVTRTRIFGTAAYVAPEQVTGGAVDGRTDLYALGCVLFEMLTSRPPFVGGNAVSLVYRHVHEPAPLLREVDPSQSASLEAFLERTLEKDPDRRPPDAEAFAEELREAVAAGAQEAVTAPIGDGAPAATAPLPTAGSMDATERLSVATPTAPPTTELTAAAPPLPAAPAGLDEEGPGLEEGPVGRVGVRREDHPRRPWFRIPLWRPMTSAAGAVTVVAVLLMAVLVSAFADGHPGRSPAGERQPERTGAGSAQPSTESTPEAVSPTSPPTSVDEAAQALANTVTSGVSAGELGGEVVSEVHKVLADVMKELNEGNTEKAVEHLADLREKMGEFVEQGEITTDGRAAAIIAAIDELMEQIGSVGGGDEDEQD